MRIVMITNTYLPHVGGVARSLETFTTCYRQKGHEVMVIAPEYDGAPPNENGVIRMPAIQNFNGSDFSVRLPIPAGILKKIKAFNPDIVHSHHPFLLGDTALRISTKLDLPIVFTHHTMYEQYTHYVPGNSKTMKQFAKELATGYANLCDHVVAPSQSIERVIRKRGVDTPITVIPTGIDLTRFKNGDGHIVREKYGIDKNAFVIGHVGRLALEKNLNFLTNAVIRFLKQHPDTVFLVTGRGSFEAEMRKLFYDHRLDKQLILTGKATGQDLVDIYHSMDLFVFASKSETQGMVLAEAMASGIPVIALNAPGVREIIMDGDNGFLIKKERYRPFVSAMNHFYHLSLAQKKRFKSRAINIARQYDQDVCAVRTLNVYEAVISDIRSPLTIQKSGWEKALGRLEIEWALISTKARAAGLGKMLYRFSPLILIEQFNRKMRELVSRSTWSKRLLKLSSMPDDPTSNGLVMIQIDGLARLQFERALRDGRLPFMRKLMGRERYTLKSFYSGIPSTTPAVQGEIFYGKKAAVPAFSFKDDENGTISMMNPSAVQRVEKQLISKADKGLLSEGSCYCDTYHGGAVERHFCLSAMNWKGFFNNANLLRSAAVIALHAFTVVRIVFLLILEVVLALIDCINGIIKGEDLVQELKFIPSRVSVCILLRELSAAGVRIDIARGVPIIHVNFFGYDEQSHRRGPDSYFAHWTLKGIDRMVGSIWLAAKRSKKLNYQVIIYSDHGQERTQSYRDLNNRTVHAAILDIFDKSLQSAAAVDRYLDSREFQRSEILGGLIRKILFRPKKTPPPEYGYKSAVTVTAKGPLGHVYMNWQYSEAEKKDIAQKLVKEALIPMVLFKREQGGCFAVTAGLNVKLPEDGGQLFDKSLPYFKELVEDITALCHHPSAGDFIISGFSPHAAPISFPLEKGAHGGPGTHETHGMVLLPALFAEKFENRDYLRGVGLRETALRFIESSGMSTSEPFEIKPQNSSKLKIMTYNVHGCRGMDNQVRPERIAETIAQFSPDIICLQEVNCGLSGSSVGGQLSAIKEALSDRVGFSDTHVAAAAPYNVGVISRYPIRLIKLKKLPTLPGKPHLEQRGALWCEINVMGKHIQIITTHLSLSEKERNIQVQKLLGPKWLLHPQCRQKTIFCGDLNQSSASFNHVRLTSRLVSVQDAVKNPVNLNTWPSRYPFNTLDYMFVSQDVGVKAVFVPKNHLTTVASDHLPLLVELDMERL